MKRRRGYWHEDIQEFKELAGFGDACIVEDRNGRLYLKGGTPEERKRAHDWMLCYLWPQDKPKPDRYPGITI